MGDRSANLWDLLVAYLRLLGLVQLFINEVVLRIDNQVGIRLVLQRLQYQLSSIKKFRHISIDMSLPFLNLILHIAIIITIDGIPVYQSINKSLL